MKLSEAIRLGAMLTPQGIGGYFDQVGTCALGAASEALGMVPAIEETNGRPHVPYNELSAVYPWLERQVMHPVRGEELSGCVVIYTLNDVNCWTREQIADWVESVERSMEPQSPAAGEPETVVSVSVVNDAETLISVPK